MRPSPDQRCFSSNGRNSGRRSSIFDFWSKKSRSFLIMWQNTGRFSKTRQSPWKRNYPFLLQLLWVPVSIVAQITAYSHNTNYQVPVGTWSTWYFTSANWNFLQPASKPWILLGIAQVCYLRSSSINITVALTSDILEMAGTMFLIVMKAVVSSNNRSRFFWQFCYYSWCRHYQNWSSYKLWVSKNCWWSRWGLLISDCYHFGEL